MRPRKLILLLILLLCIAFTMACSKKSGDENIDWEEKTSPTKQVMQPSITTRWMCGLCDTLYARANILYTFDARICPGCGVIQMNKHHLWVWDHEADRLPDASVKELDLSSLKSDRGIYEYTDMPLGETMDIVLKNVDLDVSKHGSESEKKIVTFSSTEVYEYDGYTVTVQMEFNEKELRSVSLNWTSGKIDGNQSFDNLSEILISQYGEPDEAFNIKWDVESLHKEYPSRVMKWKAGADGIESILQLMCFDGKVSISYANAQ